MSRLRYRQPEWHRIVGSSPAFPFRKCNRNGPKPQVLTSAGFGYVGDRTARNQILKLVPKCRAVEIDLSHCA